MDTRPIQVGVGLKHDGLMGQVIAFEKDRKVEATTERRHALITGLSALTFLLGFFIVGPALAIYAFSYTTTSHLGSAVACVLGLIVTWAVTRQAYKHL
jgi:hypothetical protein